MENKVVEFILANPYWFFTAAMVLGAVMHYIKGRYRGEVQAKFIDYWLFDNPVSSLGVVGALVGIWVVVYESAALEGAKWLMVVASGWTSGWTMNSALNKTTMGESQ